MLSTADRRKAASLFIALIVFVFYAKIDLAMDSTTGDEEYNQQLLTSQSEFILEESIFYQILSRGVSENTLQKTELDSIFLCYNPPVQNSETADEFFNRFCLVTNEAAETEKEEKVAVQPKKEMKKNNLRSNVKVASIKIVSVDTVSKNAISENSVDSVNVQDRGKVFVYRNPVKHTEEDELFLSMIIHGEAGNQDIYEKFRVGNAALNRYLDETGRFPQETMKGIAYANGQFGCTRGNAWLHPTEEDMQIAKELFEGKCVFPDDIVYFNNTWIDGYFYCKPGYHCFSGYLDHNENAMELLASAKNYKPAPKKAQKEVVQEEASIIDNSENNEPQEENITEEVNNENDEPEIVDEAPNEQHLPEESDEPLSDF